MSDTPAQVAARSQSRRGGLTVSVLAIVGVVALLGWLGFRYFRGNAAAANSDVILVPVTRGAFTLDITEKGELESSGSTEIRCEVKSAGGSGTAILKIVPEGTQVKTGDFILQLDSSRLQTELTTQQIALNTSEALVVQSQAVYETAVIAKREYLEGTFTQEQQTLQSEQFVAEENLRRAQQYLLYSRRLAAAGYITQLQLDADSFAVENARNALDSSQTKLRVLQEFTKAKMLKQLESDIASNKAKWEADKKSYELEVTKLKEIEDQLAKCEIHAPNDGQVKYAHKSDSRGNIDFVIEEGAVVRENQVIVRLPDSSMMRVKVNVNEALLKSVREGMSASLRSIALDDKVLLGHVEKINQYSEPSSWRRGDIKEFAMFIKVDQPDGRLLPGMSAEVTVHCLNLPAALLTPVQALYAHGDQTYCFVQQGTGLVAKPVKPGANNETFVVIEEGLSEGDQVALNPKGHLDLVDLPELTAAETQQVIQKVRQAPGAEVSNKPAEPSKRGAGAAASGERPAGGGAGGGGLGGGRPDGAPANPAAGAARMMSRMDQNGDGKLSADELPAPMQSRFGELDANSDGSLDSAELAAGLGRLRAAGGGPPGGAPAGEGAPQ